MSGMMGAGAAWRHLRSDRSVVHNRIERGTVRRVLGFARPHRRLITFFLVLTVIDAGLVVVSPLLAQRINDDGNVAGDPSVVETCPLVARSRRRSSLALLPARPAAGVAQGVGWEHRQGSTHGRAESAGPPQTLRT